MIVTETNDPAFDALYHKWMLDILPTSMVIVVLVLHVGKCFELFKQSLALPIIEKHFLTAPKQSK